MEIVEKEFGQLPDGQIVKAFTLENNNHTKITVISYGATWQSFTTEINGKNHELLVQFDNIASYLNNPFHFGNTIGRVGGRLSKTEYNLDGTKFSLTPNDHGNILHSGINNFDTVNWHGEMLKDNSKAEVTLKNSFNDEFPGQLDVDITYRLTEDNKLTIVFSGTSTENTLFNPMTHVYFNLLGTKLKINQHKLRISSKKHIEVTSNMIPTGKFITNKGTSFDFSKTSLVGENNFDDAWLLDPNRKTSALDLISPDNKITLSINSDRNSAVIFTADPDDTATNTALAIEMQTLPDAVNHKGFGDIILPANKKQTYTVTYQIKNEDI